MAYRLLSFSFTLFASVFYTAASTAQTAEHLLAMVNKGCPVQTAMPTFDSKPTEVPSECSKVCGAPPNFSESLCRPCLDGNSIDDLKANRKYNKYLPRYNSFARKCNSGLARRKNRREEARARDREHERRRREKTERNRQRLQQGSQQPAISTSNPIRKLSGSWTTSNKWRMNISLTGRVSISIVGRRGEYQINCSGSGQAVAAGRDRFSVVVPMRCTVDGRREQLTARIECAASTRKCWIGGKWRDLN